MRPALSLERIRVRLSEPHFLLGRFHSVRKAYSLAQRVRQTVSPVAGQTLRIADNYRHDYRQIPVTQSGLVGSSETVIKHATNVARESFSSGLSLTSDAINALKHAAQTRPLLDRRTKTLPPFAQLSADDRATTAMVTVEAASTIDTVQRLAGDQHLVSVASACLGYVPSTASIWLFWSLKNDLSMEHRDSVNQTVRFHYDVYWFNFMYVSFYLLDTNERNGAHVLIRGSHNQKRLGHLLGSVKISDEQALQDYGAKRIETVSGPAGSGFFEDSSCFHKALPPLDGDRLMLQIRYQ